MRFKLISIVVWLVLSSFAIAQDGQGKGYKQLAPEKRKALYAESMVRHGSRLKMLAQNQALPAAFDCRDKGWVLPVGSQGPCGSCYLYSTIYGTLTQCFVKAGYGKNDGSFVMSTQFGMDCHNFGGCNGGNGTEVIDWVMKNGWPAEKWVDVDGTKHNDYPTYEARSRACREVAGAKRWKPADWLFASTSPNRPATTMEVKTGIYNFGPGNISLDSGGQFSSATKTITKLGTNIDHEIEVIGYDDNHDNGDGTKGAFLVKNQWTKGWGVDGVQWISYQAFQRVVDVFFVTAAALPPPPPPQPDPTPIPPGPLPPVGNVTLTLDKALPAGKYVVVPKAVADMTLGELFGGAARVESTAPKPCDESARRIEELEKIVKSLQAQIDAKKLPEGPKEEKKPEAEPKAKPKVIDGVESRLDAFDRQWLARREVELSEASDHDKHLWTQARFDAWWSARIAIERSGK